MRFEIVGKNLEFYEGKPGEIQRCKSLLLQTQTIKPPHNVIRGEFMIDGAELDEFIESGQTYEELAERKLRAMLEVDITPIDAHMVENIERNSTGAIAKVRDAMEEIDVAKAEIKKDTKELQKEIERQTSVIMELALMLSQVGVYEETEETEETNSENTNPNPDENGGQGGE